MNNNGNQIAVYKGSSQGPDSMQFLSENLVTEETLCCSKRYSCLLNWWHREQCNWIDTPEPATKQQ